MKVRMKTTARGPALNADARQVVTVSPETGRDLIAGGYAELVDAEEAPAEVATASTVREVATANPHAPAGRPDPSVELHGAEAVPPRSHVKKRGG